MGWELDSPQYHFVVAKMAMHLPSAEYIDALQKLGRLVFRPRLRISHEGRRRIETVSISYAYSRSETAGSTAYNVSGVSQGRSRYVRAWVFNASGYSARHVEVFVNRISLNGEAIEGERDPLHWADYEDSFEYPKPMHRGYKNGWYVDVCASDSIDPRLQIISLRGIKRGYLKYSDPGTYKIELSAEADRPCSFACLDLIVSHDGKNWESLEVLSATSP